MGFMECVMLPPPPPPHLSLHTHNRIAVLSPDIRKVVKWLVYALAVCKSANHLKL